MRQHPTPRALALEQALSPTELFRWLLPLLAILTVLFLAVDPADAKRLGGNKSFGSKDSHSTTYDKPTPPAKSVGPAQPGPQNAPGQGGFLSRFGGIGGMLGGLMVGGLLGSLLFGGMGGGVGILEIVLLCAAGFMLFRFLRNRRKAAHAEHAPTPQADRFAYAGAGHPQPDPAWTAQREAYTPAGGATSAPAEPVLPPDVDQAEFLSGAKALYARLQAAWDRRDLADILTFTSPEVFAEISRQAGEDPTPGRTDLLKVDARVVEASREGSLTVISVLYEVLLREQPSQGSPTLAREVWHFRRDEAASRPEWILEGIQQVES